MHCVRSPASNECGPTARTTCGFMDHGSCIRKKSTMSQPKSFSSESSLCVVRSFCISSVTLGCSPPCSWTIVSWRSSVLHSEVGVHTPSVHCTFLDKNTKMQWTFSFLYICTALRLHCPARNLRSRDLPACSLSNVRTRLYWITEQWFENSARCVHGTQELHDCALGIIIRRELFLSSLEDTFPVAEVEGKCLVMAQKDYCACRPTQVLEDDIYLYESKYVEQEKIVKRIKVKRYAPTFKVMWLSERRPLPSGHSIAE